MVTIVVGSSAPAQASDATLRATLHRWSRTIAADAHAVALAAQQRHPRRMTSSAQRFHSDTLRAHAAITRQHPSSTTGLRARKLALAAYANYTRASAGWAATGRARLAHQRTVAKRAASAAATAARAGNRLLVAAGTLLR